MGRVISVRVTIKMSESETTVDVAPSKAKLLLNDALSYAKEFVSCTGEDGGEGRAGPALETKAPRVREPCEAQPESSDADNRGYKGFLLVKCEHCGKVGGFCSKERVTRYICECGKRTELRNLVPVHLNCKCGKGFTYMTNITDARFEYFCLSCGSPVDLEINKRGTAYVTMREGSM